eukprot:scaffold17231_cov32-Tisochrysis_lutea.AAC.2
MSGGAATGSEGGQIVHSGAAILSLARGDFTTRNREFRKFLLKFTTVGKGGQISETLTRDSTLLLLRPRPPPPAISHQAPPSALRTRTLQVHTTMIGG